MATRAEAALVLTKRLGVDLNDSFYGKFTRVEPYQDGWVFCERKTGDGCSTPTWWMVVGIGVCGYQPHRKMIEQAYQEAADRNLAEGTADSFTGGEELEYDPEANA